ncbi:MAG: hypothetical protein IKR48_08720 [Kiritimatiellae bacterium]|nr:hypothetical protein [Kiritimatiellia bacterium]
MTREWEGNILVARDGADWRDLWSSVSIVPIFSASQLARSARRYCLLPIAYCLPLLNTFIPLGGFAALAK